MKTIKCAQYLWLGVCLVFIACRAVALDGLVEKKSFSLPRYVTVGGATIKDVKIGYETYGKLNERRDNVILIAHPFLLTSHAAGKYSADDTEAGYWDSIIGPGKPLDTDKYFIISSDTLVNSKANDPKVVTTGPTTINPATGAPYGMSFPTVTIRDFVNVQKALVDHLGIPKLRAVMGFSMGGMQSFEWAAAYPDMVERIIPVAGYAESDAYVIGALNTWAAPIMIDQNWKRGDYYGHTEPLDGIKTAIKTVILNVAHPDWAAENFARKWAVAEKSPFVDVSHRFMFEDTLDQLATAFAQNVDANSYLLTIKAIQLFSAGQKPTLEEGLKSVRAKALIVPIKSDLVVFESSMRRAADILRQQGRTVEYYPIDGPMGHLEGRFGIAKAGQAIATFLER